MFHVSRKDLGDEITLTPKIPDKMLLKVQECDTPRVCFSPSIDRCMIGIVGYEISWEATLLEAWTKSYRLCYTVYQTSDQLIPAPRLEGSDYDITQEHWSLNPAKVKRIGYIDNTDFETFRKFELLSNPPTFSDREVKEAFKRLTVEQKDLQDKWYDHDYMRDPNETVSRKTIISEEDIRAAFARALKYVSEND